MPASEVGWERGGDIRDTLTVGQEVEVAVMHIDWEKERFTFSMKKTLADPWERIEEKYPEGSQHTGKVSHRVAFGIFVTMEPGVDGLLHISKLGEGKRGRNMGGTWKEGEAIPVKVERVDKEKRRISLSLPGDVDEKERTDDAEDYRQYFIKETPPVLGSLGEALKAQLEEKRKK